MITVLNLNDEMKGKTAKSGVPFQLGISKWGTKTCVIVAGLDFNMDQEKYYRTPYRFFVTSPKQAEMRVKKLLGRL